MNICEIMKFAVCKEFKLLARTRRGFGMHILVFQIYPNLWERSCQLEVAIVPLKDSISSSHIRYSCRFAGKGYIICMQFKERFWCVVINRLPSWEADSISCQCNCTSTSTSTVQFINIQAYLQLKIHKTDVNLVDIRIDDWIYCN